MSQPQTAPIFAPNIPPILSCYAGGVGEVDVGLHRRGTFTRAGTYTGSLGTRVGRGRDFNGTDAYMYITVPAFSGFPVVIGGAFRIDAASGNLTLLGDATTDGASGGIFYGVGFNGTALAAVIRFAIAAGTVFVNGPTGTVGDTYGFVLQSRSRTEHVFYVNGVRYSSSTDPGAFNSTYGYLAAGQLVRAGTQGGTNFGNGVCPLLWYSRSPFTDSLMRELSSDPNRLFGDARRALPLYIQPVPDDSDYIYINEAGYCEVALADVNDPGVSTGHIIHIRAASDYSGNAKWGLYQNTTLIAEWTDALVPAWATYDHTLSGAEADSIAVTSGKYQNLKLRIEALA